MSLSSETTTKSDPRDNGFFTPAQIMAFSLPPKASAQGNVAVGGGKKEKYLHGEYITLLLNMYVGQGLWDKQVDLVEVHQETVTKRRQKQGSEQWEDVEQLVVSATVRTTLIIYNARDPNGPTRKYQALCVGTNFTDPGNGRASALDKAIKSAETDGLKRTSKYLGRAFGLDLKEKIKRDALPPKLSEFQARYEEMVAQFSGQNVVAIGTPSHTHEAQQALPAPAREPIVQEPVAKPAPAQQIEAAAKPEPKAEPAPANPPEPVAAASAEAPAPGPVKVSPAPAEAQSAPATQQAQASEATTDQPAAAAKPQQSWDLTMTPSNFDQWMSCLWEINNRLKLMRHAQEIENFRSRYKRLIEKLPVLPAQGDKPGRDFKAKFSKMVSERYAELGLPEPQSGNTNTANMAQLPENV